MAKRSTKGYVGMLAVAFAVSGWLFLARPWESPVDRAFRLCGECGLPSSEVDFLIDVTWANPMTRAEKLEAFRKLFDDPLDLEYCEPCAEAVLDAAGILRKTVGASSRQRLAKLLAIQRLSATFGANRHSDVVGHSASASVTAPVPLTVCVTQAAASAYRIIARSYQPL